MSAPKVRINQVAKTLDVHYSEIMDVLAKQFGVEAKSHSSTIDQDVADKLIAHFKKGGAKAAPAKKAEPKAEAKAPAKKPAAKTPAKKDEAEEKSAAKKPAAKAKPEPEPEEPAPKHLNVRIIRAPKPEPAPEVAEVKEEPKPEPPAPPKAPEPPPMPTLKTAAPFPFPQAPAAQRAAQQQQQGQRPGQPGQSAGQRPAQPGQGQPGGYRPGQPGSMGGQPQQGGYRPGQPGSMGGQQGQQQQGYRPGQPGQAFRQQGPGTPLQGNQPFGQRPGAPLRPGQTAGAHGRTGPGRGSTPQRKREEEVVDDTPKIVAIEEALVVRELAELLHMRDTEVIKHLFMKGMMVTVNQTLDVDFARELAKELGYEVEWTKAVKHEGEYSTLDATEKKLDEDKFQNLTDRAPVVSIMGHVDHGKTTLLDSIRETRHKVVDSEAGGITQSIGAYTVERNGQKIVFLDTPGHEAFTSMRMRGAHSTDIAILVVAADDGVMPQTIEAINHAKAAKIPIIVAVNKIDKEGADAGRVLIELSEHGLTSEKWGGDIVTCEVSALQKLNLDELLDNILAVAELLELKADSTVPGEGVIVEAQLDKRMGPVATALVQNGTMRVGDNVLIGSVGGRVRALINDHGERVQEAGPATPVEILGLSGVPPAGERFEIVPNDKDFKQRLNDAKIASRDERLSIKKTNHAGFSGRKEDDAEGQKEKQFHLLVKADTQGSLEAVVDMMQRMTSDEVKINIVHSATGEISEADVMLASTANALIIGFNSNPDSNAFRLAEQNHVTIKKYDVIYHIMEDIEKWVLGQLEQETEEVEVGSAEVRQIFTVGKTGIIAGCMVTSGKVIRNSKAVVMRNGKQIYTGPLSNLKRFKDDAKEVASGYECGISFDRFNDMEEGDIITVYTTKVLERTSL